MSTPTLTTVVSDLGVASHPQRCNGALSHRNSSAEGAGGEGQDHPSEGHEDEGVCRTADGMPWGNSGLVPGLIRTLTYQVHPRDLVNTLFPESSEFSRKPAVLATGILVALCEWPAIDALRQVIGDDEDSLGTGVSLSHQAPVCVGTRLTITARCVSVAGRTSRWDVCACDGTRTVACGWVEFAVVHTAAFLERHQLPPADGPTFRSGGHLPNQKCAQNDRDRVISPSTGRLRPMVRT